MNLEEVQKDLMSVYDMAAEIANKEGKSHREVFCLMLDILRLNFEKGFLQGKIKSLSEHIKQLRGENIILTAIKEGKVGKG